MNLTKSTKKYYGKLRKTFKKKKNQRRLFYCISAILIVGLSATLFSTLHTASNRQADYKQTLQQRQTKLLKLHSDLQDVRKQKADTDSQLQQKAAKEAELQRQVDELNRQLQVKRETMARQVPRPTLARATPIKSSIRPMSSYGNTYTRCQCTWGVKNWRPSIPNGLGNASSWFYRAQAMGMSTGYSPRVGAVAQKGNHVALVIGVSGSQVLIKEMNYRYKPCEVRTKWASASLYRYIY